MKLKHLLETRGYQISSKEVTKIDRLFDEVESIFTNSPLNLKIDRKTSKWLNDNKLDIRVPGRHLFGITLTANSEILNIRAETVLKMRGIDISSLYDGDDETKSALTSREKIKESTSEEFLKCIEDFFYSMLQDGQARVISGSCVNGKFNASMIPEMLECVKQSKDFNAATFSFSWKRLF